MANQSNLSPPDNQLPQPESLDTDVDERDEAPQQIDADLRGRTYTVAGFLQAHAPQKSLGSYVKAG
jgi:hypothetical protein